MQEVPPAGRLVRRGQPLRGQTGRQRPMKHLPVQAAPAKEKQAEPTAA